MQMFKVNLQRQFTQVRNQSSGIEYIRERAVSGNRTKWKCVNTQIGDPLYRNGKYVYECTLVFEKQSGHSGDSLLLREWNNIIATINKLGAVQKFQPYPWKVFGQE